MTHATSLMTGMGMDRLALLRRTWIERLWLRLGNPAPCPDVATTSAWAGLAGSFPGDSPHLSPYRSTTSSWWPGGAGFLAPAGGEGVLKIMPMGDSITDGLDVPGGYRGPLYDKLTGMGYAVDFVGSQRQPNDDSPDRDHWGRPGRGITATNERIGGLNYVSLQSNEGPAGAIRQGLYQDLDQAISPTYFSINEADRNILLLMVGTNDVIHQVVEERDGARAAGDRNNDGMGEQQNRIAESSFDRLSAFTDRVNERAASSGLQLDVIVATIPDVTNEWNAGQLRDPISNVMRNEIREYNELIKSTLPERSYSTIDLQVVDQYASVGASLADGIHPTPFGYQKMAETWWCGISHVLA
jgi:lysophospholipase L1-like esterase